MAKNNSVFSVPENIKELTKEFREKRIADE